MVSYVTGTRQQVAIVTTAEKDSTETPQSPYQTEELVNVSNNQTIRAERDVTLKPHKSQMKLHCLNISEKFFKQFPRQHFLACRLLSSFSETNHAKWTNINLKIDSYGY